MDLESCPHCQELLDHAASAILRHIRAVGQLDTAILRGENELIADLKLAVKEASRRREEAMCEYREHRQTHIAKGASASGLG